MTHRVRPRHAAPSVPFYRRLLPGRRLALLPLAALLLSFGVGVAGSAGAATAHDPLGFLDSAVDGGQSTVSVTGWAADPDAFSQPVTVLLTVDGAPAAYTVTAQPRPDVSAATGAGPNAGFSASVQVTAGSHQVCAAARNIGAGSSPWLGCRSVTVAGLPAAYAAAHNPAGYLDSVTSQDSTVSVSGWAIDPDALSQPLRISATLDGRVTPLTGLAAVARPDVAAAKHSGPNAGFRFGTSAANGQHTLCVIGANLGPGAPAQIGCATVQVGPPPLTPAQIAAHSPHGALEASGALTATSMRVRGWATDPDNKNYPLVVVAYVDGVAHTPVRANVARPDLSGNQAAGPNAGYAFNLAVGAGSHIVCLWAMNIGIGANQSLGCAGVSTPAVSMPTGPTPPTPAVNAKIAAAAKKYLGSRYVWGGADPKVGFDCSGLVQYTYRGAGLSTPRVAQDQFAAARMIAPGRAVPGDLVFYHDDQGAVYHVGIYVSPGVTYAAVDPANGVRIQSIWDPDATYGSFTHS
ncbi:MAG TPA: C40 family peptidase [Jatrophihabitans sp.]|nr:C40 family peptidase [Jatrophihabitans sp.]